MYGKHPNDIVNFGNEQSFVFELFKKHIRGRSRIFKREGVKIMCAGHIMSAKRRVLNGRGPCRAHLTLIRLGFFGYAIFGGGGVDSAPRYLGRYSRDRDKILHTRRPGHNLHVHVFTA